MPTNTTYLGMKLYNSTTDGSATFATWRADFDGISTSSNFNLLDTFCQNYSASVVALQGKSVYVIPAVYVSSNYYEANGVSGITSLTTNMLLDLYLDTTNVGTVTLNINSLGIKTLKKVDASGNYVDLDSNDLLKSKENLFRYNGTYFIWIGQSSGGSGISSIAGSGIMSDTSGSVVKHNISGVVAGTYLAANITVDDKGHITVAANGTSASSTGAPADSPFIVSGSVSGLTNAKQLIAGSYMTLTASGSTLILSTSCSPLSAISGSGVMSDTTGSIVRHNVSGVIAGSANKVEFDIFGHIKSASVVPVPQTATMTAGQVLQTYDASTGAFTKVVIPLTSASIVSKALGGYDASTGSFVMVDVSSGSSASSSSAGYNYLINGGFDRFQRSGSNVILMTDDTYNAPDMWYSLIQGSGPTVQRIDGATTKYALKMVMGGTTNRGGFAQIIPSDVSIAKRGKAQTFQFSVKPVKNAGSGTIDMRIALLEWTGTADTVTSDVVQDWTSSDYTVGASKFFINSTLTLVGTAQVSAVHNIDTQVSVSGIVSTSCNNLILSFWTEDVPDNASDYIVVTKAGLYDATATQTWTPRPDDLFQCMLFYEKNIPFDIAPADNITYTQVLFNNAVAAANAFRALVSFKAPKYKSPVLSFYRTSLGAVDGRWNYLISGAAWYPTGNVAVDATNETGFYTSMADDATHHPTDYYTYQMTGVWVAKVEL